MTSVSDFLFIYYKKGNFIINRSQFSASVGFDGEQMLDYPTRYVKSYIRYDSTDILSLDLDSFLKDHFKVSSINSSKISIISNLDIFSKNVRSLLENRIFTKNGNLSKNFVSFSITSSAEITNSSLERFKLLSNILIPHLGKRGILSCSFRGDQIEYFIDLETFLLTTIGQQEEEI